MMSRTAMFSSFILLGLLATACGRSEPSTSETETSATGTSATTSQNADTPQPSSELETHLPDSVQQELLRPFDGDFDAIIQRRLLRVGVTFDRTLYFVDKGVPRGIASEYGRRMEEQINARRPRAARVHVFLIPMPREKLLPALIDGRIDLAAGHLTITPERLALVDFSDPTRSNVSEILVTGPQSPAVASVDDLSGQRIFVPRTSSYEQSLRAINVTLKAKGRPPVDIVPAPDNLTDDDLIEMVNAGLLPAIIVDDYLARFWARVFPDIVLHENVAVRSQGSLGIAIRKNAPQLRMALNRFMGKNGLGTAFGNTVERRYLQETKYVKNAASDAERRKFMAVVDLFRKYGDEYSVDYLLMAAQGYQESGLNQNVRSRVGAIGIMQIMPATGKTMEVGDIRQIEPNIHAGVKFIRYMADTLFKDEPLDPLNRGLLTLAAYNAGPGRIRELRKETERRGLDPNVWFGNVEQVVSARVGRETVNYVSNIYKYYVAYRLVVEESERRTASKASLKATTSK
jgi:membrane-bound lytic murein transglycosylase MltF